MRDPLVVVAMFRFIVFIALVAGSIYAAPAFDKKSLSDSCKSLKYSYHFQHVFTDPRHSKIFAILNVKTDAIIFPWKKDWLGLKFENVSVEPLQSKINCPNPLWRMLTKETTPEIYNSVITTIVQALEIPITFKYKKGVFTKIKKHASDADESVNIKRGLLSLFEIDYVGLRNETALRSNVSSNESVYLEKSVQGLCKTNYLFSRDPSMPPKIDVIKTIFTDSCIVSPRSQQGLIMTVKEDSCKPKLNMMETSSIVRYKINNAYKPFEINEAVSESRYNLLLNSPSEGSMVLSLNQTLKFISTVTRNPPEARPKIKTGLISEIPSHSTPPFSAEDVIKQVVSIIRGDIQAKNVNDIIMIVERLDIESIKKIWSNTASRRYLVVDIFTKVDSKDMKVFWTENILLLVTEHLNATSDLALFQSPDRTLMESLLGTLKTARLSKERMQQLALKIGAYANKFSVLLDTLDKEIRFGDKLIEQAEKSMLNNKEKLDDVKSVWAKEKEIKQLIMTNLTYSLDKVVEVIENTHQIGDIYQLKTMGNMGYNKTIPTLIFMIKNRSTPLFKRIQAVDSLRKMPQSSFYDKIQSQLLQVYVHPDESVELRIKSFLVLTKYPLSQSMIMALILTHQHEVPSYVGPFAFKYLSEISKSKFAPLQKMRVRTEKVLTSVEPALPMMLKEKMSIPHVYEEAHELWRRMSSFLVWHFSVSNALSLSSAAMDLQVIPGVKINKTSIIIRVRCYSLANYDDIEMEISTPYTAKEIINMVRNYDRKVLDNTVISLKRNDLELRQLRNLSVVMELPEILCLIWNSNQRIIPTASGGFLRIDQKSTIVARNPVNSSSENTTVTSECHVNSYIDGFYINVGGGMKTSVKVYIPGKWNYTLSENKLSIRATIKPTKKTSKLVSIEQVPFTLMRVFLPKYYKEGVIVDMQELPIVLSEHATDVNYIKMTKNFAMRAQLPMTNKYPQDIITSVWYGIHSISFYYRDEETSKKDFDISLAGNVTKESTRYKLKTEVRINENYCTCDAEVRVISEEHKLITKLSLRTDVNNTMSTAEGEISIPRHRTIPAKCLFSNVYQSMIIDQMRKVDLSQPCLIRSQIETISPKYARTWNKLISIGLLNFDENEHNLISEVRPESITSPLQSEYIQEFFREVNISKRVKEFNEAAFHPLNLQMSINPIHELYNDLINDHHRMQTLLEKEKSLPSTDLLNDTYRFAVLYEKMAIHAVSRRIFMEAIHKISYLNPTVSKLSLREPIFHDEYRKLVEIFNTHFDPLIEKMLVNVSGRNLFNKIREVETLLLSNRNGSDIIQLRANELLTLIPESFDPENKVTDILFLRAHQLISTSIVFKPSFRNVSSDSVYEFWQLRQDIIMYFTLKHAVVDILPCEGQSHKLICQMLSLITKDFELFHHAASYKRAAVRSFNTKDSDYANINKLMLEFDNLLRTTSMVASDLIIKTSNNQVRSNINSTVAIVQSWYRLATAVEWSTELLNEYQSIWSNIREYGMVERVKKLEDMKKKIIKLWNNLKIKESCKSETVPVPIRPLPTLIQGECNLPESLRITAHLRLNSTADVYAEMTAKKSLEQLIYDHQQKTPGFRSETSYRYLENYGRGLRNTSEEYNIFYNINAYQDLQFNANIANVSPLVEESISCGARNMSKYARWFLRKYWNIEDMRQDNETRANMSKLPTIRVIQYMNKKMADVLVIRPRITESYMEVPILYIPIMHLPVWSETPDITPNVSTVTPVNPTVNSTTVPTWQTTPSENSTTVSTWQTTPAENSTTVSTWQTTPAENSTAVSTSQTTPAENSTAVSTWQTTPSENSTTVSTWQTTPAENSTTVSTWQTTPAENSTAVSTSQTTPAENSTAVSTSQTTPTENSTAVSTSQTTPTENSTAVSTSQTTPTENSTAVPTWKTTPTENSTAVPTWQTIPTENSTTVPTESSSSSPSEGLTTFSIRETTPTTVSASTEGSTTTAVSNSTEGTTIVQPGESTLRSHSINVVPHV